MITRRLLVEATYTTAPDPLFATAATTQPGHGLTVDITDPKERILHATGPGPVTSLRRTVIPKPQGAQWRDIAMVRGRLALWRLRLALTWHHRRNGGQQIKTSQVAMLD